MKFKEFYLRERPEEYVGNAMPDEYILSEFEHYNKSSNFKTIKDDDYEYRNYSNNAWFVMKDGTPVSMCIISKKSSYAQIIATTTIGKMKNKGLASKLYSKMINEYGGVLSDGSLSKNKSGGSWFLYEKLIKQFPAYIVNMALGDKYKSMTSITSMPESDTSTRILLSKTKRTGTKLD